MTITPFKDGKLVVLSKPLGTRIKILSLFWYIVFFLTGGFILIRSFGLHHSSLANIFMLLLCTACFIASYRFANKAMETEQLIVDARRLCLIKRGLRPMTRKCFDLASISHFRHLEKPEYAKHPITGENYDYFGFQTTQKLIQEMHGDHRLAFDHDGTTVTFGEHIYSWEFDELAHLLAEFGYRDTPSPATS